MVRAAAGSRQRWGRVGAWAASDQGEGARAAASGDGTRARSTGGSTTILSSSSSLYVLCSRTTSAASTQTTARRSRALIDASSPLALHARSTPLAPSDRDPPNSPASIRMDSRDIIRSIPSISATRSVAWLPTPDWSPPRLQPVLVRSMHWLQMRRAEWRCGTTQPGVGDRGTAEPRKPPSRSGLQPAMRMHAACQSG